MRIVTAAFIWGAVALLSAGAQTTPVHFRVFTDTGIRLTGIIWTGHQFLFIQNTTNRLFSAPPAGKPLRPVTRMPRQVEESRCVVSMGGHGYPSRTIFCHSPTNRIYRMGLDGKRLTSVAVLPHLPRSDGALTFDQVGTFGHQLLVATGRSGSGGAAGGQVFAVSPSGAVRHIGSYPGPGGADEIAVAPASFGSLAGQVLLPVDAGKKGVLLAMSTAGRVRAVAHLDDGPNPIAVLSSGINPRAGRARPGLYVTDTSSHRVYFASAASLRSFRGDVVIGSELRGHFWVVRPHGTGVRVESVRTDLPARAYNFEAAIYLTR